MVRVRESDETSLAQPFEAIEHDRLDSSEQQGRWQGVLQPIDNDKAAHRGSRPQFGSQRVFVNGSLDGAKWRKTWRMNAGSEYQRCRSLPVGASHC